MSGLRKSNRRSLSSPLERLGRLTGQKLVEKWAFIQEAALLRPTLVVGRPDFVRTGRLLWGVELPLGRRLIASSVNELQTIQQAQEAALWGAVRWIPYFGATGRAAEILRVATDRALHRHAALFDAFGIEFDGAFIAPNIEWPFTIVEATLAENLELVMDELPHLHTVLGEPTRSQRDDFNQLLTSSSAAALQIEGLEAHARSLYAMRAEHVLREIEVLIELFSEHTGELARLHEQLQALGAEAKLEVFRTLIVPVMQSLRAKLTALEESDPKWPFPRTQELLA